MGGVEWSISDRPIDYERAVATMAARVAAIRAGTASEQVWLLEHPPLYTAGTSANPSDLVAPAGLPVYRSGRGGQYTYHGPGQRVAYVMLDLQRRGPDLRCYVHALEEWIIRALGRFDLRGERRQGRIGIWIDRGQGREDKIAAIGVRVSRWVTSHGVALNVDPALEHFRGIVPCGIAEPRYGVTSLRALGVRVSMRKVDVALRAAFDEVFETRGAQLARRAEKVVSPRVPAGG